MDKLPSADEMRGTSVPAPAPPAVLDWDTIFTDCVAVGLRDDRDARAARGQDPRVVGAHHGGKDRARGAAKVPQGRGRKPLPGLCRSRQEVPLLVGRCQGQGIQSHRHCVNPRRPAQLLPMPISFRRMFANVHPCIHTADRANRADRGKESQPTCRGRASSHGGEARRSSTKRGVARYNYNGQMGGSKMRGSACIFALEVLQLGLLLLVLLEERFEDLLELYIASTRTQGVIVSTLPLLGDATA
ncbi:hypothetical protein L1887_62091 [Cichorium endivia]|nr:hypothetical protein L1887_62091 [Cichorium endivia]